MIDCKITKHTQIAGLNCAWKVFIPIYSGISNPITLQDKGLKHDQLFA